MTDQPTGRIGATDDSQPQPIRIGSWVYRRGRGTSHKVESLIEDRVVTKCGRQMRRHGSHGDLSALEPGVVLQPCVDCMGWRGKPTVAELEQGEGAVSGTSG